MTSRGPRIAPSRAGSLRAVSAAAACATAVLAIATRTRELQAVDDAIEAAIIPHRPRLRRAASIGTLPGERFAHPVIGAAFALAARRVAGAPPRRVAIPMACASLGAILAHHGIKLLYRRARPDHALRLEKWEPAFPSGHTADSTAVLATGVWILAREGVVPARVGAPVAASIAITTGVSRVALGWHWSTDVVGGWLTGIAVAGLCAGEYERRRAAGL